MKPWERYASQKPVEGPWSRYTPSPASGVQGGGFAASLERAQSVPGYEEMLVRLESGGNAKAKAPTSSATGLHQFTTGTWLSTVSRVKPAWAEGLDKEQLLALRADPEKSKEMERALREETAAALHQAGAPITAENLYAGHHFGARKGTKFAQAEMDTPMASILTAAQLQANPYLRGKTKREAIDNWRERGTEGPWANYKGGANGVGMGDD